MNFSLNPQPPRRVFPQTRAHLGNPVNARKDSNGHWLLAPSANLAAYVARAVQFQEAVFQGGFIGHGAQHQVIATAIAVEGIGSTEELQRFLDASTRPVQIGDVVAVCWTAADDRLDRRFLQPCTRLALAKLQGALDWKSELAAFDAIMGTKRSRRERGIASLPNVTGLLLDMAAWHFVSLPAPLFLHVTRVAPAAVLPDCVYARKISGRPLAQETARADDDQVADTARAHVLDAVFNADRRSGAWLISELRAIGAEQTRKSRPDARRDWLKSLIPIAENLAHAGPAAAALFGWQIHMLTVGTPRESNPSPVTIHAYFSAVATDLLQEMGDCPDGFLHLSAEEFSSMYERIHKSKPSSSQVTAALNSFHFYLIEEFGVPPVRNLVASVAPLMPRANVLWSHEASTVRAWLGKDTSDERLAGQVRLAFELGLHLHLRIGEILGLRVGSIRQYSGSEMEVEIVCGLRERSLKSRASRRIVQVGDNELAGILGEWVGRRATEAALPEDFLFGDPHEPDRIYRYGATYVGLSRLLKAASGDPGMSPHALRHGVSAKIEHALMADLTSIEINPLDMIAAEMGHVSIQTDLHSYFHQPERPLRHWIDRGIAQRQFNYRTLAWLTGMSEATLRQKVSRFPGARDVAVREILARSSGQHPAAPVEAVFSGGDPPAVVQLGANRVFSVRSVGHVLADLAAGMPVNAVALRNGVDSYLVTRIAALAVEAFTRLYPTKRRWRALEQEDPVLLLQQPESAEMTACFPRLGQAKVERLLQYISDRPDSPTVTAALSSWRGCAEGRFVSLEAPRLAWPLIVLLQASGISLVQLAVRAASSPNRESVNAGGLAANGIPHALAEVFDSIFGGQPQVELVASRRGRPRIYLLITGGTNDGERCVQNAAASMHALHAAMVCLSVFRGMRTGDRGNDVVNTMKGGPQHA